MIGSVLRVRYELLQELGEGPVFHAYIAHDRVSEKNVVLRIIKEPFSSETPFIEKLREVVNHTKLVTHQFLSAAVEVDEHNGRWFLVYRYQPGQPLGQRLKKVDGLGISTSVAAMIKMLDGLSALHKAGEVHGDLRAENVILSTESDPTLLLPGVWQAYSSSATAGVAMLPKMAPYLAPEVSSGGMPTARSDVYAMGVLLFEMLTGSRPFQETSVSELSIAHATASCPSLRKRLSSAPEVLERIIEKAMDKSPFHRYQSADPFLEDLKLLQDAMKFGKPMTWPLKQVEVIDVSRVGPKLNTVRAEDRDKKMSEMRSKDQSDGAPKWLVYTSMALITGAIAVIAWWMLFRLSAPSTLKVPNIVGMSFSQASTFLGESNLKLRQTKLVASEQFPEGIVIAIKPNAGRDIKEFSFVDATVSSGSKTVEVPDLAGKTVEEAKRLLSQMGLSLTEKIQYVFDSKVPSGTIVSQRPGKHLQVPKKTNVEIEVSKGKAVVIPEEPPSLEPYLYHLSWSLPDGTAAIKVRVEMRDASGQKTIYEALHDPNEKVEIDVEGIGERATFTIYYDDRVVKTLTQEATPKPEEETAPPAIDEGDEQP